MRKPGSWNRMLILASVAAALSGLSACGDDDPTGPADEALLLEWTFAADLDGWQDHTDPGPEGWGTVSHVDWGGDGMIGLDGTGNPSTPNAWITHDVDIPANARTLRFKTSAHNRDGADSEFLVALTALDGAGEHVTLIGWTVTTGAEDELLWEARSVSLLAWVGRRVRLEFYQNDNGPGSHEQRYFDDIQITG